MPNTPINSLLILSAPRSGASVLSGCLQHLGLETGPGQAGPCSWTQDIWHVHDLLFRDLGCSWDMIGSLPQGWTETKAAQKARDSLQGILSRNTSQDKPWAAQDPRLCRVLPLWLPVLEQMGYSPGFVLLLRHPWEVALSLQEFQRLDLLQGHLLWLAYNREALGHMPAQGVQQPAAQQGDDHSPAPRAQLTLLSFDQLLADPVRALQQLQEQGLNLPCRIQDRAQQLLEFVRPELKHQHQGKSKQQDADPEHYAHFASIYDLLRTGALQGQSRGITSPGLQAGHQELQEHLPYALLAQSSAPAAGTGKPILDDLLHLVGSQERQQRDHRLERERRILSSSNIQDTLHLGLLLPEPETGLQQAQARRFLLPPEEWTQLLVPIPDPELINAHGFGLLPLNTQGLVALHRLEIVSQVSGEIVFQADTPEQMQTWELEQDLISLPAPTGLLLLVSGNSPRLHLQLDTRLPDSPLQLRLWVKAGTNLNQLGKILQDKDKASQLQEKLKQKDQELQELQQKLEGKNKELQKQKSLVQQKHEASSQLQEQVQAKDKELQAKDKELKAKDQARADLDEQLKGQTQELDQVWAQLKKHKEQLQAKDKELQAKDQELKAKDQACAELEEQLKSKTQELEENKRQIQQLTRELEAGWQKSVELEAALEDEKARTAELQKGLEAQ